MALKNSVNPNEVNYVGGKKHSTDVLKNSGDGTLLIWRQPEEDFNNNSILIVEPGEEAIFVNNGKIEQVFTSGRYKLHTQNYPFLSRLQMRSHGGISSYNSIVYFVRKAHTQEIYWGTDSPLQVRDKVMGIATSLRARGSYKVQINNPALFLEKLIGNNVSFQTQEELSKYFIQEFQQKIKSRIAKHIEESDREILGIDARLEELSDEIRPDIQSVLEKYGLLCVSFVISAIDIQDDILRKAYDEANIRKYQEIAKARGEKEVLGILDEDWGKIQAKDLLGKIAENPAGGAASAGAGLGMGMAAGNVFGTLASQVFSNAPQTGFTAPGASGRFVSQESSASSPEPSNQKDHITILKELKTMLDADLITQEEYDKTKQDILDELKKQAQQN